MRRVARPLAVVCAGALLVALAVLLVRDAPRWEGALTAAGWVFERPSWLWGLAAMPLLWASALAGPRRVSAARRAGSAVLRTVAVGAALVAAAGPARLHEVPRPVTAVVALDVSHSMPAGPARALWRELRRAAAALPPGSAVRVVPFAERAGPAARPASPFDLARLRDGAGTLDETDIAHGVGAALAAIRPGTVGRLLVVSDGHPTRDVAPPGDVPVERAAWWVEPRGAGEIAVTGVEAPRQVQPGAPFDAVVVGRATQAGSALCGLRVDGREVGSASLHWSRPGEARARFEGIRLDRAGAHSLTARCTPAQGTADGYAVNNEAQTIVRVRQPPRLLYVSLRADAATPFVEAIRSAYRTDVLSPVDLPHTPGAWSRWEAVVWDDVPLETAEGDVVIPLAVRRALEAWVRKGGLLLVGGGPHSYGAGGYAGTRFERELMPLRAAPRRRRREPDVALVLVIDRSGSMSGPKIAMAKAAARATAEVLRPDDLVAVVAFDAEPTVIVPLRRAAERLSIGADLGQIGAGGGTAIGPALRAAYSLLRGVGAPQRHVILLTDGQSERRGVLELAARMVHEGITVSTVAVGMGADTDLLGEIADIAGGRAWVVRDARRIPRIFVEEARALSARAAAQATVRASVTAAGRAAGLMASGRLPSLGGHALVEARSGSSVLVRASDGAPLLARRRVGTGWVLGWASELDGPWARAWVRWRGYARWWRRVLVRHRVEGRGLRFEAQGALGRDEAIVYVDVVDDNDAFVDGLRASAEVRGPQGDSVGAEVRGVGPGRYEVRVPARGTGTWRFSIAFEAEGRLDEPKVVHASVTRPWPEEFDVAVGERDARWEAWCGMAVGGPAEAAAWMTRPGPRRTERRSAWTAWAVAALLALLADVAVRRVAAPA